MVDSQVDLAAIGLELRLTGSAGSDTSAQLRHGLAATGEPRELILKLRQLDLQLALAGAGMTGKDVQDELRPVDDPARQLRLKVPQLRWCQIVIEEYEIGVGRRDDAFNLLQLALPYEGSGIGTRAPLNQGRSHLGTGAAGELLKLLERGLEVQIDSLVRGLRRQQ